jgi:hypothetical protein
MYLPLPAAVFGLAWLLAAQEPGSPSGSDTPEPTLTVSLSRIREMVAQPVGLRVALPERPEEVQRALTEFCATHNCPLP